MLSLRQIKLRRLQLMQMLAAKPQTRAELAAALRVTLRTVDRDLAHIGAVSTLKDGGRTSTLLWSVRAKP